MGQVLEVMDLCGCTLGTGVIYAFFQSVEVLHRIHNSH